ncbi:General transcription factor 3C polypeptide 3 [Babesia sp. Xinjiang]|uniref:General transcription factor 3C polypeptide 3 n=1 Tax=Babesia sp. Xinjiang TaxID=462227 RepID=UPI000A21FBA2|nr:General transcription factor 3C polypeptide 3 [Babesia sp. Xinjiang]ORM41409.1 General transcription factor 3C polypeptide 3 [Babesia sp. Xinjiang]
MDDGECSDAEVDEEELNSFLMGDVLAGSNHRHRPKLSFADKHIRKLMRRNRRSVTKVIAAQRKKRKRKTAAHASKLTPQLEKLMQDAMTQYLGGNFDDAIKILKEVVRRAPGLHDPFHMLGLIYQEEYGDLVTATGYYLLAAHLVQTDLELWRRIGEMSQDIGNIDQAIYCFKKCLKTNDGEPNEEAHFALAMCYLEKQDHHNAIKRLHFLYELHPDDALLLNELSKSLVVVGDKETLLSVLLMYYGKTGDLDAAKRACQIHISLCQYEECINFVKTVASNQKIKLSKLPISMLVSYTVAALYTDAYPKEELDAIWFAEQVEPNMIYCVAMALVNRCQETALKWFKRGYDENDTKTIDALLPEQAIQMAKSLIIVDKDRAGAELVLQKILMREPANSQVIILLADILGQAGKHSKADELLARLTTSDLDRLKMIQKPIGEEERSNELRDLEATAHHTLHACFSEVKFRPRPCLLAQTHHDRNTMAFTSVVEQTNLWINRFLRVVSDCELDTERTYQKLINSRAMKSHHDELTATEHGDVRRESGKNYSFLRTKKELGLLSVEDILGWKRYEKLLVDATALMATVGRAREGVQLLEIIATNKKRYKSNAYVSERKQLVATVEELSYRLSCFGSIFKMALVHARSELASRGSLKKYATLLGSGNLAKAAFTSLSSSAEKDTLLENRSWITRQLLIRPQNFELLMLAGHFCTMSGNWPFAIEEYKRALMQRPEDPVAALCLGTSYFNALSSKAVGDSKKYMVIGMSFLQYSLEMRASHTNRHPCRDIFTAESLYNLARAMHFLNLLHIAIPLYEKCIQTIRDFECRFEGIDNDDVLPCACVICYMSRRNDMAFPHEVRGLAAGLFVWKHERRRILRNQIRGLRTRALVGEAPEAHYVVENPKTSAKWPPIHDHGDPFTIEKCKKILFDLNALEIDRMVKARKFNMPSINLGDLIEVKYELSRTQQTFATFQGYCVEIRNRGLNSSFTLKNAFDGVGVTQMVPCYSPRLMNVKVMKSVSSAVKMANRVANIAKPITRDYRYRFHLNVRHRFSRRSGVHKPGIRSFESRLKNRIVRLKNSYYQMRLEAGLPAYVWGGAYNLNTRRRSRLVRAETNRRIRIYSMDEERSRREKLRKRRQRSSWGVYKVSSWKYP